MPRPELKKKWWLTNKPKEVKGVELERALAAVELAGEDKRATALAALSPAITKACKELDKNKHKDLLKDLGALETLAEAEVKKLQAAVAAAAAKAKAEAKTKAEAETKEAEDEAEPPPDRLFDPELHRTTLRRALKQPLVFAFAIGNKPEQCALALAPRGNPLTYARLAKTQSGAPKVCCGQAQAAETDPKKLVLSLAGTPVSGIVKALRLYLLKHKLSLFRKVSVMVEGQEVEAESFEEELPAAAAPAQAPAAAPAVEEPPEPPPTPKQMEILEDRRREFKKARAAWVAVKARAEEDLEKVKDGAHVAYLADQDQFPKIVAGCREIDTILDNLDDALRDTLDQYASTPLRQQKKLQALAAEALKILDGYRGYVANNALMKAIDYKEFADVTVHAPVMKALDTLRKALA